MRALRLALALLALSILSALPARAAAPPEDVAGWEGTRWGMTGEELAGVFGAALTALPGRREYGGAYADGMIRDAMLGGVSFRAFPQMDAGTGRLRQVLLERRDAAARPADFNQVVAALVEAYGPPGGECIVPKAEPDPLAFELVWRFPTTTIHLSMLDFQTTGVLYENPNLDRDILIPELDTRTFARRLLPRRLLVRFHDSTVAELMSSAGCR